MPCHIRHLEFSLTSISRPSTCNGFNWWFWATSSHQNKRIGALYPGMCGKWKTITFSIQPLYNPARSSRKLSMPFMNGTYPTSHRLPLSLVMPNDYWKPPKPRILQVWFWWSFQFPTANGKHRRQYTRLQRWTKHSILFYAPSIPPNWGRTPFIATWCCFFPRMMAITKSS